MFRGGFLNQLKRAVIIAILLFAPLLRAAPALADGDQSGGTPTSPDSSQGPGDWRHNGPNRPNGPDGSTYHFNGDTGLWENDYFTWNPVTHQAQPKNPLSYSYNPATGKWDTKEWIWNSAKGRYVPNIVEVQTPPPGALITTDGSSNSLNNSNLNPDNSNKNNNSGVFDLFNNPTISNSLYQSAQSGDATVGHNTTAGDATSGNAQDIANIINLLQSSAGLLQGSNMNVLLDNIYTDHYGDIILDPTMLSGLLNLSSCSTCQTDPNVKVNASENSTINNDITLDAKTGNASVIDNTTAGNATSGDASAVANLLNLINTNLGAKQSLIGVINIYGNLDGDILLPPGFLDSLISSGDPCNQCSGNGSLTSTADTNQTINNDINSSATSGGATVADNTTAGNATTGNASTNVTLLNLTGRTVVGKDAVLVFVNVLGKWMGVIMNSQPGQTAAALGSGITQNALANAPVVGSVDLKTVTNQLINNTINVSAASGDATVAHNTTAGNATSGNASTAVNLANITNSNFSLSDWFAVFFINVFGTWNGSFGKDTAAGGFQNAQNPVAGGGMGSGQGFNVFGVTKSDNGYQVVTAYDDSLNSSKNSTNKHHNPVLAATSGPQGTSTGANSGGGLGGFWLAGIGSCVCFMLLGGIERVQKKRQAAHFRIIPEIIQPRSIKES